MAEGPRYDRAVNLRMTTAQYDALLRVVARGQYESPASAIRRAVITFIAAHGEPIEDQREPVAA